MIVTVHCANCQNDLLTGHYYPDHADPTAVGRAAQVVSAHLDAHGDCCTDALTTTTETDDEAQARRVAARSAEERRNSAANALHRERVIRQAEQRRLP